MLTKEEYEMLFEISPESPSWLKRKSNGKNLKRKEGGYYCVSVNGKLYRIHRIIMTMLGQPIEGKLIDHIDRDKLNNNPNNLRVVTNVENARNCKMWSSNKTGITGVSFNETRDGVWSYVASWKEGDQLVQKWFSVDKYSKELAFELACCARNWAFKRLLELNLGYTEYHGT